jgi:hypothetical protein
MNYSKISFDMSHRWLFQAYYTHTCSTSHLHKSSEISTSNKVDATPGDDVPPQIKMQVADNIARIRSSLEPLSSMRDNSCPAVSNAALAVPVTPRSKPAAFHTVISEPSGIISGLSHSASVSSSVPKISGLSHSASVSSSVPKPSYSGYDTTYNRIAASQVDPVPRVSFQHVHL